MAGAANYKIRVRGHVDAETARRLRGLSVENTTDEGGAPVATLQGDLPDQAALMGVLHTLNDHYLPLLSAKYRPPTQEGGPPTGAWHLVPWTAIDEEQPEAGDEEEER